MDSNQHKAIRALQESLGLQLDLLAVPDERFTRVDDGVMGDAVESFEFQLPWLECGLFDRALVHLTGETSKNVVLYRKKRSEDISLHVQQLVNQLVAVYGEDDYEKKAMTDKEMEMLRNNEMWWGRHWMDALKFKHPASLTFGTDLKLVLYLER